MTDTATTETTERVKAYRGVRRRTVASYNTESRLALYDRAQAWSIADAGEKPVTRPAVSLSSGVGTILTGWRVDDSADT